jgi:hypothetical protein
VRVEGIRLLGRDVEDLFLGVGGAGYNEGEDGQHGQAEEREP